ncbi:MAG TPA: acyl-CoA dehydrogenase [Steroidobacteraceae bacterium]
MDFAYNEEQRLLADSVGRWLDTDYRFEDFRRFAADPKLARTNWTRMAELGLLSVNIAEADGGLGGGPIETLLVMQALGRALVVDPYVGTAVIAVALISAEPPGARRRELLEQMGAGACRISLAALEPEGRYDLARVQTVATACAGGFALSGKKAVVLHGDSADRLIVSARTAGAAAERRGISLFLIDAHAAGITIRGFPTIDGQRAAEIEFDDVRVGSDALLAHVHDGIDALEWAVDRGIAALCAEAVGAMEKLLELTAEHLRARKQFGQPIGRFQGLQHRIADMAIALEQARSMALLAAAKIDDPNPVERRQAISAAKVMIGRCGRLVGQQAVQLHGGMGMTDEMPIGYFFKRLTAIDMSWGNVEHHVELYGDLVLNGDLP